eukprot:gene17736-24720_t
MAMPARYHTAKNGVAISGQCRAYTSAPSAPASKPAPAPAHASRVGAAPLSAQKPPTNAGTDSKAILKGQVRQVLPRISGTRSVAGTCHRAPRAMAHSTSGGTFTAEDESGDANQFTRELAKLCEAAGVQFRMGHHITALREAGGRIDHVEVTNAEGRFERVRGDAFVLAMGSFSPLMAQPLGIQLPIYPAKGYSVTMPVKDASKAHQVSLTDDEFKLVFSRYTSERGGDRLRIAGTAEFNGMNRDIRADRIRPLVNWVNQCFPGVSTRRVEPWAGLRPMMPNMMPRVGSGNQPNVFYNTGHGHLGWTLSAITAHQLGEHVAQWERQRAPRP